jgi:hypothetical protein
MVSTNSRNHFMDLNKHHENGTNVSMSFLQALTLWLLCTLMTYNSLLTPEGVSAARGRILKTVLNEDSINVHQTVSKNIKQVWT